MRPRAGHDLSRLRTVLSTGSPLAPESYDYVYRHQDLGRSCAYRPSPAGTDLISCFALGNPDRPGLPRRAPNPRPGHEGGGVRRDGEPMVGEKGELVCTQAVPLDAGGILERSRRQPKYHHAYFDHFPGIWRHGDWAEITERGGMIIYGRSDATLNPGGVRIGTAEIYRQVSGKITELAVREVIHGRPVKNADALANPEALELFRDLPELAEA